MKKLIVIHASKSQEDYKLSIEDIVEMNSQERFHDSMPNQYIVNTDGTILKGRTDREVCGHCGRWSVNSLSVAYAGGLSAESGEETDTLSETQEKEPRTVLKNVLKRNPEAEVTEANELLHPDEARRKYEPFSRGFVKVIHTKHYRVLCFASALHAISIISIISPEKLGVVFAFTDNESPCN